MVKRFVSFQHLCLFFVMLILSMGARADIDNSLVRDIKLTEYNASEPVKMTIGASPDERSVWSPLTTKEGSIKQKIEGAIDIGGEVNKKALDIVSSAEKGTPDIGMICLIHDYLRTGYGKGWKYVPDPIGNESFRNASYSLSRGGKNYSGAGDCDDYAIVWASFIETIGGVSMIILARAEGKGCHMYTEVYLGEINHEDKDVNDIINWLRGRYNNTNIKADKLANRGEYWLCLDWNSTYPGGQPSEIWEKRIPMRITDNDTATKNRKCLELINQKPLPIIHYDPENVVAEEPIRFDSSKSNDSDGTVTKYEWDFGDNSPHSNLSIISHIYDKWGKTNVTLNVTDNVHDSSSKRIQIFVNRPTIPELSYEPRYPRIGGPVTFNASGLKRKIVNYNWSFGDGEYREVSDRAICSHAYMRHGNYKVNLTAIDEKENSVTNTSVITVNNPPVPSISWDKESPNIGDEIKFNTKDCEDDGKIVSYLWSFGDGTNATGVSVSHSYTRSGRYNVGLWIKDDDNASSSMQKTININSPPIAAFAFDRSYPSKDDIVNFDASRSYDPDGSIKDYQWSYGDGKVENGGSAFSSHRYQRDGNYTIKLTLTDDKNLKDSQSLNISVKTEIRPPIAYFSYYPANPTTEDTIVFNADLSSSSNGYIKEYQWDFDDNSTKGNSRSEAHKYEKEGIYKVRLTATDDKNLNDSQVTPIPVKKIIIAPPTSPLSAPQFSYQPDRPEVGKEITFDAAASQGSIKSYQWDFGDGSHSEGVIAKHIYSENGPNVFAYDVILTVTDTGGSKRSFSKKVTVYPPAPLPSFTFNPDNPLIGQDIAFNASSSQGAIKSYIWNFGDNSIEKEGEVINHAFISNSNKAETYDVKLTVTDESGTKYTITKKVTVYPPVFPSMNALWIDYYGQKRQYLHCLNFAQIKLIANSLGGSATVVEIYPNLEKKFSDYQFHPGYNEIIFAADEVGEHVLSYLVNGQLSSNCVVIYVVDQSQSYEYPSSSQSHSSQYQSYPSSSQSYPSQYQSYPSSFQSYPSSSQSYPLESQSDSYTSYDSGGEWNPGI
jgi:PKD repeat protein